MFVALERCISIAITVFGPEFAEASVEESFGSPLHLPTDIRQVGHRLETVPRHQSIPAKFNLAGELKRVPSRHRNDPGAVRATLRLSENQLPQPESTYLLASADWLGRIFQKVSPL